MKRCGQTPHLDPHRQAETDLWLFARTTALLMILFTALHVVLRYGEAVFQEQHSRQALIQNFPQDARTMLSKRSHSNSSMQSRTDLKYPDMISSQKHLDLFHQNQSHETVE